LFVSLSCDLFGDLKFLISCRSVRMSLRYLHSVLTAFIHEQMPDAPTTCHREQSMLAAVSAAQRLPQHQVRPKPGPPIFLSHGCLIPSPGANRPPNSHAHVRLVGGNG